jgi:hypothetical protein
MPYIQAAVDTVIKRSPIDSLRLAAKDKIAITVNQAIAVESVAIDLNQHAKVFISGKFGDWSGVAYIFIPHWKVVRKGTNEAVSLAVAMMPPRIPKLPSKVLDYVEQPDARTCQSAAIARVIGSTDVYAVRSALEKIGTPGDPAVMGVYLRDRVREYKYLGNASISDLRAALKEGYQAIVHGVFTGSGHVIGISGADGDDFICEDPWAGFYFMHWTYAPWNRSGNDIRYSAHGIYAACVAGQSPDDAWAIYRRGELDSNRGGLWLHLIRN